MLLPLSVCLSVSRITERIADEFNEIVGWLGFVISSSWLDFSGRLDNSADTGIIKRIFTTEGI